MSNFHILSGDDKRKIIQVVFHVPIPAGGTNTAGISWQAAVVLAQGGADNIVSVLPGVTPQEESDLKAGVIYEVQNSVRFSSVNLTNAQRLQEVKDYFTALLSDFIAEKQITLDFMGYEGDV